MDSPMLEGALRAIAIPTVAGFAFAAGRLRERLAALSRHVTAELRRFGSEMTVRFDSLDRRMSVLEGLLPHVWQHAEVA
jgi:hypothetical protein